MAIIDSHRAPRGYFLLFYSLDCHRPAVADSFPGKHPTETALSDHLPQSVGPLEGLSVPGRLGRENRLQVGAVVRCHAGGHDIVVVVIIVVALVVVGEDRGHQCLLVGHIWHLGMKMSVIERHSKLSLQFT